MNETIADLETNFRPLSRLRLDYAPRSNTVRTTDQLAQLNPTVPPPPL